MKKFYQQSAASYSKHFRTQRIPLQPTFLLFTLLLLSSLLSIGQTTYNFSTAASLSNQGGYYTTQALVTVDGVSYKLTHLGNGNFSNLSSGGNGNSACLKKDGSGGDFLKIERADGAAFQFYGMWLNSSSMYNPPYYFPPYYNIKYYDQNNAEITAETFTSSVLNETITVTKNLKVKYVYVTFNAILYFKLDDLVVGPAAASAPTVSTSTINQFTNEEALVGGNVTDDGGAAVLEKGIVYNTTGAPTTEDNIVPIGTGAGSFSQSITGLSSNTLYYMRSYAINSAGTSYGSERSFITAADFELAQIHYFNSAWASTTSQASPFTKYVEGWNITATSTGSGLVSVSRITGTTGASAAAEGAASARASSSTSAEDLVSMSVKASTNSPFDLQSFKFKYLTKAANTSFGTITVTGYSNGIAVPGAVASLTGISQASSSSYAYSTFDLSGNSNFNSIDEFVVTASDPVGGARLSAIDIDVLDVAGMVVLPVTIKRFSGSMVNGQVLLNWNTSRELDTRSFDVERSPDGVVYTKIGSVSAGGNRQAVTGYSFTDGLPAKGLNYYRLQMNDIDGKYTHSAVVTIKTAPGKSTFSVYPNPVLNGHCFIEVEQGTVLPMPFRIVDGYGKSIQNGAIVSTRQKLNLQGLARGNYFILLNNGLSRKIIL